MGSFFRQFHADLRFYDQLTRSGEPSTAASLFLTALRQRGVWLLQFQRVPHHFSVMRRNPRSPVWWAVRIIANLCAYLNAICFKSSMRAYTDIGSAVYLANGGYLICGPASIGSGTLIHDHTIIGFAPGQDNPVPPVIGRDVWIGPNCIIAGAITIGDGATILPDTLLTFSLPARAVASGNPATIVQEDFDNSTLRKTNAIADDIVTVSS